MARTPAALLDSWRTLLDGVEQLDEMDLIKLLILELNGQNRKSFISRVHQRFNRVRADRERKQLSAGTFNVNHIIQGAK